jgi:transposase
MINNTEPIGSLGNSKEECRVKLGLDVHAKQITICRQEGGCLPQPAQKMSWEKTLEWIGEQVASDAKVYSCYEAGPCGYGLHRQLEAMGVKNLVVAPQRWDERGQRVKTDKRDARELVDRLDRYLRGNTKVFSVVRVPTPQEEQRRSLVRQRATLLKERNRCVVRGHGLMLAQGVQAPAQWWQAPQWEKLLSVLPPWLCPQVDLWRKKALDFTQELTRLDAEVSRLSAGKLLIKGLGSLTSAILESEVLDWNRFQNRRQVGSYTGLCPSENSSGAQRKQGSINKHGNPRVRHHLVEAAWRLLIWQPYYPPLKALREASGTRARKRAVVAVARRLAVDLWRISTGQCSAQKLGLLLAEPTRKA